MSMLARQRIDLGNLARFARGLTARRGVRSHALILAAVLVAATPLCLHAQATGKPAALYPKKIEAPPRSAQSPDVQILILSTMSGPDQVDFTYPSVVPKAQAKRDIAALAAASSWPIGNVQIKDSALPLSGVKSPPLTSITFTADGLVRSGEKGFWLEPFIVALKSYKKLTITYMVPKKFVFSGLHDYSDQYVRIALDRRGSVYTYAVDINNSNFSRLNLPLWQSPSVAAPGAVVLRSAAPVRSSHMRAVRVACVVLVGVFAVLVGLGVYVVLSRAA